MQTRFNFDRQLWQRFVTIAQPYFLPLARGSGWSFLGLIALLMYLAFALLFLLVAGLTLGVHAVLPDFMTRLAPGLTDLFINLIRSPFIFLIILGILLPSLAFVGLRGRLTMRWQQWLLLGSLLFLSFAVSGLNVVISYVGNYFQTALSEKDQPRFWFYLYVYASVFVVGTPLVVIYRYIQQKLGLIWRQWLTDQFLSRYFSNRAYYELDSNAANTEIDNPDQRITQDTSSFTRVTLSFLLIILGSILDLVSFTGILYSISKTLTIGLIIYATLGTVITVLFGKRLIGLNFAQLRLEADFRYSLIHVRDNAESIAFYRGEDKESSQVTSRFRQVLSNFDGLIKWQRNLDYFTTAYGYLPIIIPSLIVAPRYFAGELKFGDIAQAGFAFSQVLGAVSIIVNQIESITGFAASINRLGAFNEALTDPTGAYTETRASNISTQIEPQLAVDHLTLLTPNSEQTLIQDLSLHLEAGEQLLIVGSSGCGKSSLLRAIAGLWTNGSGSVTRPDSDQMLFLPQKPYMLLGTLRDQLIYPRNQPIPDPELNQVLAQVNLESLPTRFGGFDIEKDWSNTLSLGEQQRLAFARILITQPRYLILDEATSALDIANEKALYEVLQNLHITYVSVGHRASLIQYHQQVLELNGNQGWQVMTAADYASRQAIAG